jgi:hydrophobic/amphiphilic exporter-1 (mainly G- bacteria), HAE1 family
MGGMGGGSSAPAASGVAPRAESAGEATSPRTVFIRDVARVVDTHWERRSSYRYLKNPPGGKGSVSPAIEVSVIQDPGASSTQVVPEVMKAVRQMETDFPGVHFETAYDNARFTDVLFNNIWGELVIAILMTGVALLLFLGDWRAMLVALISLPASLILAILFMVPFGMSFNSGTLIGLLISIGRLVDDSIVNVHAVERHLRMGKDVKTASIDGIGEIRLAVLAGTFTTFVGLSPLLFAGGIVELMFRELVWPVIFCQLSSMIVGFTLTTLLCAKFLRREEEREADRSHWLGKWLYRLLDPIQRLLERIEARYEKSVRWTLKHRFVVGSLVLTVILGGFTFYYFLGSEMMPLADVGQASAVVEMSPGASFEETEQAVQRIEQIMLKYPELEKGSIEVGAETMFESWSPYFTGYQMPQVNGAAMMLTFSDKDSRRRTLFEIIDAIQKEALATIPGIRRFQIKEMGSDVMATSAAPIHILAYGPDLATLDLIGQQLLTVAQKTPGLYQSATTWTMAKPKYEIKVDPVRAQNLGLSPESISQQTYYSLRGGLTNEFYRLPNLRQNTILVRYEDADRKDLQDLGQVSLTTPDGRQVPLKAVARVERHMAPTVIEHDGLRRVIGLTSFYRNGDLPSMDVTMSLVGNAYGGNPELGIKPINFPPGYGLEMRGDMTQMMDSFRRLLVGLGLSLIFMYLILVAQFRGFLQPMQMLASLPDQLAGIFFLLWLTGMAFSSVSIMAIIVVAGMDITTAILILDLIVQYRDEGVPRDEAVAIACRARLRPIIMSAAITAIAIVPAAFFPKTGQDAYRSLAIVTIGGLLTGTFLSLFDIPIMHTFTDDVVRWVNKIFLNRDWKWPVRVAEKEEEGKSDALEEGVGNDGGESPLPPTAPTVR